MWGDFVDDFRKAPYPKDWDKKGFVPGTGDTLSWNEVKATYLQGIDDASAPYKEQFAKPALKKCLDRLREVPVLRRVLAQLRECGSRRTTRPNTTSSTSSAARPRSRTAASTTSRRPSSSAGRFGTPSRVRPATEKVDVVDSSGSSNSDSAQEAGGRGPQEEEEVRAKP